MNFYYDPILGLCYTDWKPIMVIDMTEIPKTVDLGNFIKRWKQQSVLMVNSKELHSNVITFGITTKYIG